MHQPTDWHDRLELEDGQIVRIVWAEWIDKRHNNKFYSVDVYKENDAGEAWSQNLYCSIWGGCTVMFPGLPRNDRKNSCYYDMSIAEEEGFSVMDRLSSIGWSDDITKADEELVCSLYPDFKYVFKKYHFTDKRDLMKKLMMWIPHHDLELLLAAGFEKVGMNGSFWRLTEKNRKATCNFMRQNPQFSNLSLREIREAMRANDPVEYGVYLKVIPSWLRSRNPRGWHPCISFDDYKYMRRQQKKFKSSYNDEEHAFNELVNIYNDYIRMLYQSEHNTKDVYWRYPSDIQAFHDRLVEEERIKEETRRMQKAKEEEKRLREQKKAIIRIEKKFAEINKSIDGYSIFVTSDYDEWQKQAKALHQCICACGYYQGTADGNYTIVFIQKEGVPVATAQVYPSGKIGQFYADETDRANCAPSEEVRAAFNKWLEAVPKSKFKKSKPRQRKSVKKEVAA